MRVGIIPIALLVTGVACAGLERPPVDGQAGRVPAADWEAVEHCLVLIRQCQLPDGMIRARGVGQHVWGVPYLGNFAGMALLAAHEVRPNADDVRRVERWLQWYAAHQEPDGTIDDQEGTVSSYQSRGRRDSTDSYAATYLMLARRYRQAVGETPPPAITGAARKAFAAIEAVTQADGLTIAKPDYPMKYLMDNLEVYGGLDEGARFFDLTGYAAEAARARKMAVSLSRGLRRFWSETNQCFAVGLDQNGVFSGGLSKPYPEGLAQLFALAHLAPERADLWQRVRARFQPGDEGMPIERWVMAASRCAPAHEQGVLRSALVEEMRQFSAGQIYVDRPALAVLALINGKARFPNLPSPVLE